MTFSNHNKIIQSSILVLSSLAIHNAHASSEYTATANYTFTVTATNLNTNSNSLSNLSINTSIDDQGYMVDPLLDFTPVFTSSSSNYTGDLNNFTSYNTTFLQEFHATDSISNDIVDTFATSEYLGSYILTFLNESTNADDIFDITFDYSYTLSTTAIGENANTDVNIALSNEYYDETLDLTNFSSSSIAGGGETDTPLTNGSGSYNFLLYNDEYNAIYADTQLTGTLQTAAAELAPVPVPAAFWLFSSAIIALPGIRKIKNT